MEVDYQVYAEGEALLGWLNCTAQIAARKPFPADRFLEEAARAIQERLRKAKAQVAHLKMTFSPDASPTGEIAAVSLVRNDFVPELSF
ncbi:cobalamin biosynthesis protein P47K, partial [Citrobacter sp. AAK_AS5]